MKSPLNKWEFLSLISGFALILLQFIWVFASISGLPDSVPIHFDSSGSPDNYGTKYALFMMPGISLFTFVFMQLIMQSVRPEHYNYPFKVTEENKELQFKLARTFMYVINCCTALLFCFITFFMVDSAKSGSTVSALAILLLTVVLVFVPIVVYYFIAKSRL